MLPSDPKEILRRYFDLAHEAMLWKLEGLGEYDLRRPMTPTGTNLLGLVKHLAWVELGYFGDVFGRPHDVGRPEDADEVNADMYATADEASEEIVALFRRAWAHATATIEALDLDAEGHVPWWGENNPVTLRLIVVHMTTELHRHLGHADILREQIDGAAGHRPAVDNLPDVDDSYWAEYHTRLAAIAESCRI